MRHIHFAMKCIELVLFNENIKPVTIFEKKNCDLLKRNMFMLELVNKNVAQTNSIHTLLLLNSDVTKPNNGFCFVLRMFFYTTDFTQSIISLLSDLYVLRHMQHVHVLRMESLRRLNTDS